MWKMTKSEGHEIEDENTAHEVQESARRSPFRFSVCGIGSGVEIAFVKDGATKAVVVDDSHGRLGQ